MERAYRALYEVDVLCRTIETLYHMVAVDALANQTKDGRVVHRVQELALRYVLEDGKLNVCLRNLVEWREFDQMRRTLASVDENRSVRRSIHYIAHKKQDCDILAQNLFGELFRDTLGKRSKQQTHTSIMWKSEQAASSVIT